MAYLDITYVNPAPMYTGGEFREVWQVENYADGRAIAADVTAGDFDPFLGDAWVSYTLSRNRNPNGTYAKGSTLTFIFRRPANGEYLPAPVEPNNAA